MKFNFKQFQFDTELQILSEDGNVLSLSEKPAQILTLFLLEANKIHTKADILDKIWRDRVVTEQVVFQNINYLRSLFGNDAIKTFNKKGYQWQLPLEIVAEEKSQSPEETEENVLVEENLQPLDVDLDVESGKKQLTDKAKTGLVMNKFTISSAVVLLLLISWFLLTSNTTNLVKQVSNSSKVLLTPHIQSVRLKDKQIQIKPIKEVKSNQMLFDSPFSSWQRYAEGDAHWLLATKLYPLHNAVALRFHIQGSKRAWQDYIFAKNEGEAVSQLHQLLLMLGASSYFSISSNHGALAELEVLLNQHRNHELLTAQLIMQQAILSEFDRATALIDQQLATNPSALRRGLLNLSKTEITFRNRHWLIAEQSIQNALSIFQTLNLPQLESRALIQSAWGYIVNKNFRQGIQILNQAASKARASGEPLQEVNAHLLQSFMSSKAGQTELAHAQLDQARKLIELHNLGEEHQVPVQDHLGWIAKSPNESLAHYEAILAMPFTLQYERDFYSAAKSVRDAYIQQQNWDKALASIKDWQRPSFQALSQAHVAFARGNWELMKKQAEYAFRQAQVDHQRNDGLDASLLLMQYQSQIDQKFDTREFDTYIQQNNTRIWLDQNKVALQKLNKDLRSN